MIDRRRFLGTLTLAYVSHLSVAVSVKVVVASVMPQPDMPQPDPVRVRG
jgi:hypothetical protein